MCGVSWTLAFTSKGKEQKKRRLKKTAVPSEKLPVRSVEVKQTSPSLVAAQAARAEARSSISGAASTAASAPESNEETLHEECEDCLEAENTGDVLREDAMGALRDHGVQTDLGETGFFDVMLLTNREKDLNVLTGIPSVEVLSALEPHVQVRMPGVKNVKKAIVLTMMKLKLGLSFTCLGVLFQCDRTYCSRVFKASIVALADVLSEMIDWPSKDEVRNWMPKSFRNFLKTRVVLDCTEVPVEKPQCLICRVRTYSHYYGEHTLKFMVGCSPSGSITFVSKAYGGRASDKKVFCESGLIDKLEPYVDAVMVDKGFMIEDVCEQNAIELIRPPFLKKQAQLTKTASKLTAEIARARVHVERVIQRLKLFNVLKQKMPWSLLPHADAIITTVCGITNLCNPVIADDGF